MRKNEPGRGGKLRKLLRKYPLWIPLGAFLLSLLLLFTPLDHKIFDLFQRTLPPLTESPKVCILTLDDDSVDYGGGFPFRREVLADIVILLKELGAASITFDLSFLDKSPNRYDPDYAAQVFSGALDDGFGEINAAAGLNKEEFTEISGRIRSQLEETLPFLTRDADEYFSRALRFTGCSWLTLTFFGKDELAGGEDIPAPLEEAANQIERAALKNIENSLDSKTPQMFNAMPAIPVLLKGAKGAGTVNAGPDSDGIRRRLHLLYKYRNSYYGNLALIGMSDLLGNPSIASDNREIILKGARINGSGQDIRIPRTTDGSVLLKWPKKEFSQYLQKSLIEFIQYIKIEPHLADNLAFMEALGFFSLWDDDNNPRALYTSAESLKNELLENYSCSGVEKWLALRRNFFSAAEQFLCGGYEDDILAAVAGYEDIENKTRELFAVCREQFYRMDEIRRNAGLEGAFCVIGSDATSMTDYGTTPIQENFPNVGTYAVLANMILSQEFLGEAPLSVSALIALVFCFGIVFITSRYNSARSLIFGFFGVALLSCLLLSWFHITKQYIGGVVPLAATTISFAAVTVKNFLGANREKAFLYSAFSRYLSPQVISEIIADPSKLNLGGEKREMTALFTDIQGFSTISEKLDPAQLVRLLNRYLTMMSGIIMQNGGTVDKYEGDAIIAFFGAPLPGSDHAVLACRSALAMKKAEVLLNTQIMEEGLSPSLLFTRIGINTGEMVVGNMGAENKMDYTIMGNAVNLAARLEGVNKQYQTGGILISEYTREQTGKEFISRRLDRVRVVGINTPLRLYELLGERNGIDKTELERLVNWEQAIACLEERRFEEAAEIFKSLNRQNPDDRVAELYARRCITYSRYPPPDEWDGINNLTEK